MRITVVLVLLPLIGSLAAPGAQMQPLAADREPQSVSFEKRTLTDQYYCDGINTGDFDRDGHMDIVARPFWYAGPDFKTKHEIYPAKPFEPAPGPTNSLYSYVYDFNRDGWPDILVVGRVHLHEAVWYENPRGKSGLWPKHYGFERVQGETPAFGDVDRDGLPELLTLWEDRWGFLRPDPKAPTAPWSFKPITERGPWQRFYHGEGLGDINGDGRVDVVLNDGWWEQPPAGTGDMLWKAHPFQFSKDKGGAQILVYDVNGDGRNDVITALNAHAWGLAWFEQVRDGGRITFREHKIMGDRSEEAKYGVAFTQPHALALGDFDGDGLQDIVVGKRLWAHGPKGDVEPSAPPVLYWFQLTRGPNQAVKYIPHLVDDRSGVGCQVTVADVNGDKRPDILTVSKLGAFLFLNRAANGHPAKESPSGARLRASVDQPPVSPRHYVFAHYMVCFAACGERVEDYKREIRQAQAAGIDGFALNCGAWHNEPHYPRRTKAIFEAARELGTGFKLFFSVDFAGLKRHPPGEFESYVLDMVKTYGRHPNQLLHGGRVVVSTFAGEQGVAWQSDIIKPLKAAGYELFLVPFFYPRPRVTELPDEKTVRDHYAKWADLVDGMFYFGAAGTAEQLAASNAAYTRVLHEAGKVSMASFSPMYWGASQPNRRYYETRGGEGTQLQWKSIIEHQPDWVEIVTWNDFNESYLCSVDTEPTSNEGRTTARVPHYLKGRSDHAGYLELSRYYIQWYKTGRQPPIKDSLFYFYRRHPKDATTAQDRPVKAFHGDPQDVLYVTTMMTAEAELHVASGTTKSVHPLQPGIQHLRIPFAPGPQQFTIYRTGKLLLSKAGEPIADKIDRYDFFPTSGFAHAE